MGTHYRFLNKINISQKLERWTIENGELNFKDAKEISGIQALGRPPILLPIWTENLSSFKIEEKNEINPNYN